MSNKNEMTNLLFPPLKLLGSFLFVTMTLILGTAFSASIIFNMYLSVEPELMVGILFILIMLFCAINVGVTRGSFLCAKILKYYALFLLIVSISSLSIADHAIHYMLSFINIFMMSGTFYLISGKTYQQAIQYKYDFFEDIKKSKKAVEKEILKKHKKT